MADFLIEIGTEEIPAWMIPGLYEELAKRLKDGLKERRLGYEVILAGGAPRRFGCLIQGIPAMQPDAVETVAGPPMRVARGDDGEWTKAALGFARKQGVELSELGEVEGMKGPCVGFERELKGRPASEILSEAVPAAVEALFLPKAMRWGEGTEEFVRPVRWVVALLDDAVVPMAVKGVASGRISRGHRIYGAAEVKIPTVRDYFKVLRDECVRPDPEERKAILQRQLTERAAEAGGRPLDDPELLEQVVFLSEYPSVLRGDIPERFLELPSEILVTCLREHQKFFSVVSMDGTVMPHFLSVVDAPGDPNGRIRKGNENVTISRLADAEFFFEQDRKVPLEDRLKDLDGIVFHPKIGTYGEKARRMETYARELAPFWGVDPGEAARAALLCKCDLATLLVQEKEFTSLQGKAGGLYAAAQGESEVVAGAIRTHYRPAAPDGASGSARAGYVVAAADKLDSLVEMFRIGLVPTGSKDPLALRRAAADVMEILSNPAFYPAGDGPRLHITDLLRKWDPEGWEPLAAFLEERLKHQWESVNRFRYDEINAVLAAGLDVPLEMRARLEALHQVRQEFPEDFDALSVAFKRSRNILKGIPEYPLDPGAFLPEGDPEGAGERGLHAAYERVREQAGELIDSGAYAEALRVLAGIRPAVDRFYDDVLVMCDPEGEDPEKTKLQQNRLALLQRLVALFRRIAALSEIVPQEN